MQTLLSTRRKHKGFAVSIDALLALILFMSLVAFLAVQPIKEPSLTAPKIAVNQLVGDAMTALDNTGIMMISLEQSGDYAELQSRIDGNMDEILPNSIGYTIELNRYEADLSGACRSTHTFSDCFPPSGRDTIFSTGRSIPPSKDIFHGRKIFVKKESGDCTLALSPLEEEVGTAYLAGSHAPEARDVNITTMASCPAERNPCPEAGSTIRCCYQYQDEDGNPQTGVQYAWYKYDFVQQEWALQPGLTNPTVDLEGDDDGNRWKCSVRVSDGIWGNDTNSPIAIVGGPCFAFDSNVTKSGLPIEDFECSETYDVGLTLSAEAGGRRDPVDIMLSMDRSGSMSWIDRCQPAGTERSVFFDESAGQAYLGTSSYVYKISVGDESGSLEKEAGTSDCSNAARTAIDDARDVFVDGSYVFVADGDTGLTIIDKSTMSKIRTIGEAGAEKEMTTARSVYVEGEHAYVAAAGTIVPGLTKMFDASMTWTRDDEERIGYDASRKWAAQSFQPNTSIIDGVRLELRRYGNPGDMNVHIRETINGEDLNNANAQVSAASIGTEYAWVDVDFQDTISVTPGETYFIVLTTESENTSNYYRWGSRSSWSNPYSGGCLYRCDSGNSCECQNRWEWFWYVYEDARFRAYYYGELVGGLVTVNISDADPSNWFIEGTLYDTGSGLIDEPRDVFAEENYAYVADASGGDGTHGLWIVDVSDAANPTATGFFGTTNAQSVTAGNGYAYIADEDSGLRIINIADKASPVEAASSPLFSSETVKDVFLYDTNAYAVADIGSGETATGVHVVDAENPESAAELETFYSPYTYYRFFAGQKWALLAMSYGLITIDRAFGPKINFSRNSAKNFVLFEEWDSPSDKLGAASYGNGNSSLDHELAEATAANKQSINNAIGSIMAEGGTPMHLGLEEALDELLDSGRGREEAVQFLILLADGQSDGGTQDEIDAQVQRAENNQVYIFTIGFGGDVDETQMAGIAEDAYCPNPSEGDCGSYHHIEDPQALSEVYSLIREEIANLAGAKPDSGATDISMEFSQFSGLELSGFSPTPSSWDGTNLVYSGIDISTAPWFGEFKAEIPCDYIGCEDEFKPEARVSFPPAGSQIEFSVEGEAQEPVEWPEKFSAEKTVYYADLTIEFLEGKYFGEEDIQLEYRVENVGYKGIDLGEIVPTVDFNHNPGQGAASKACNSETVSGSSLIDSQQLSGILEAAYGNGGINTFADETKVLPESGYICMALNDGSQRVDECSGNNKVVVWCKVPLVHLYTLDYWAWKK